MHCNRARRYVQYITEVDLDEQSWFAHVPDSLQLEHTFALFTLLSEEASASREDV